MNHACLFILLPKDHMLLEKKNRHIIPSHLEYNVMHIMGSLKPIKTIDGQAGYQVSTGVIDGKMRSHHRLGSLLSPAGFPPT